MNKYVRQHGDVKQKQQELRRQLENYRRTLSQLSPDAQFPVQTWMEQTERALWDANAAQRN